MPSAIGRGPWLRSERRWKRSNFRAKVRRHQGFRSKTGAPKHHNFIVIPDDQAPAEADSFHQHLGTIAAQGPHDRRRQGKNNDSKLTDTGERLSEIVKGLLR